MRWRRALARAGTNGGDHRPNTGQAIVDRGYRGRKTVNGTEVLVHGKTSQSKYFRAKMRARFRRRTAVEPLIGHLKDQYRRARCFLKGFVGDQVNLLLAAAAWNLRKWLRVAALFWLQMLRGFFAPGQFRLCAVGR